MILGFERSDGRKGIRNYVLVAYWSNALTTWRGRSPRRSRRTACS